MKISKLGSVSEKTKRTFPNAQDLDGFTQYEAQCDALTLGARPNVPLGDTAGTVSIPTQCVA